MHFRRTVREAAAHAEGGDDAEPPSQAPDRETLFFAYEMLVVRNQTQATLLWQTPSLALTAQAFLLTIALIADFSTTGHVLAALLGIVVAVISMQTMAKHRYFESLDNFKMQRLEYELGLPPLSSRAWRKDPPVPGGFPAPKDNWWIRRRSYWIWQIGLGLFGVVNLIIILISAFAPDLLGVAHAPGLGGHTGDVGSRD